jgi:hypothetical protein
MVEEVVIEMYGGFEMMDPCFAALLMYVERKCNGVRDVWLNRRLMSRQRIRLDVHDWSRILTKLQNKVGDDCGYRTE